MGLGWAGWRGLVGTARCARTQPAHLPSSWPPLQTHDIGFIMLSSFGDALGAQPPPSAAKADKYRRVLQTAAASLAKR